MNMLLSCTASHQTSEASFGRQRYLEAVVSDADHLGHKRSLAVELEGRNFSSRIAEAGGQ